MTGPELRPWWEEPFDHAALKRAGFTYHEVRELERIRMEAIPLHVRKAAKADLAALFAKLDAALEILRLAAEGPEEEDEEEAEGGAAR